MVKTDLFRKEGKTSGRIRDLRVIFVSCRERVSLRRAFLCLMIREREVIHFLAAQWQD